jgi:benzylsuccinate CoA-transferase BbsF subunit
VYPCAGEDRWCAISACDDKQWATLATLIGFASNAGESQDLDWRLANQDRIDDAITAWTSTRAVEEVEAELQSHGVPAHAVLTSRDLFSDVQLAARGHFVERDHPAMGPHLYEMPPYRLQEHAVVLERSPLLGEHTDDILGKCLGMTPAEIAEARESGALE